jgi:hypothetical protein
MNNQGLAAAAAILGLVAGGALPAFAGAASPVSLDTVRITAPDFQSQAGETIQSIYTPGIVDVTFRNTADVAATSVTFAVAVGGREVGTLTDSGRFAPGVAIEHVFTNDNDAVTPNAELSVASVTFSNGTTWTPARPTLQQTTR